MSYRGVVKNGVIVLSDQGALLQEGAEVLITPLSKVGHLAALLEELRAHPVDKETMNQFERIFEEAFPTSSRGKADPGKAPRQKGS